VPAGPFQRGADLRGRQLRRGRRGRGPGQQLQGVGAGQARVGVGQQRGGEELPQRRAQPQRVPGTLPDQRLVREEAEARQPNAPVTDVSDRLAVMLSERQELSVAAARLGGHQTTVDSLVRASWLRRDRGRIAFAHEAFFDYAYAQQHMPSGLALLGLLRSGEQHLFRRAQVRQILALEREQEPAQYLRDVREILAADDVRPHVKELVVALVTLVPDPGLDEWRALSVLGDATADSLAERACWLAAQAPGFSRLLLAQGIIAGYLSDPGTTEIGTWMCTLLIRNHPDRVAELLRPYVDRDGWSGRLVRVLNSAPPEGSEQAVSLMVAVIAAGGLDAAVRPDRRIHALDLGICLL
jgi:hypothetical protein